MSTPSLVGASVRRSEDRRLLTGRATYVGDLVLPGLRHVAFVRSPYPAARIGAIDPSPALAVPGVIAVVTGADLAADHDPMPMAGAGETASPVSPREWSHARRALPLDCVRHVGEAVVAVVAATPMAAADGAEAVGIAWEPLPFVVGVDAALAPGAPLVFDDLPGNVHHTRRRSGGDVAGAFARASRIVRARLQSQRLAGMPMEGRAVAAAPDPGSDGLTLWSATQAPHLLRHDLARCLRLPEHAVRVVAPEVGGGFGVKFGLYPEELVLAILARKFGYSLRWLESRSEHLLATTHGRAQVAVIQAAVADDGEVLGLRLHVTADLGAYPIAPGVPELTGRMAAGVYKIPAIATEVSCVHTNTTPVAAYRGAGRPEAAYYVERLMDLVAAELGLDPAAVRQRNFIPPSAFPYVTPTGERYDTGDYPRALARALELAGYARLREEQRRRRADPDDDVLLGIGLATYVELCGVGPYESATVRVDPSGSVTVLTGLSPHGQGQATTLAQIVADRLGVAFDRIVVRHGDTREGPMGVGTMASRGVAVGGAAAARAADKVRERARTVAAHLLEAALPDVQLVDGVYGVIGAPGRSITFAEIAHHAHTDDLPDEVDSGLEATDFFRPRHLVYPFGAHVAVVEVERATGTPRLTAYVAVDDCGNRINPLLAEGQIHGGLAQGIAQALLEAVVFDDAGELVTGSFLDYALPRASDFPLFVTDQTVTPTPLNPLGAKGIGEAATIGSTPAVVNAVLDALAPRGVRHLDMPLTPEKIWRAIEHR